MFAPQLSQNAETARIAAAQAEFNEKKWVWVPDDKEGYLAGWVVREEGDMGQVVMAAGGEVRLKILSDKIINYNTNINAVQPSSTVCTIEDEPSQI